MKISYKFEEENQIFFSYYQRDTKLVLKFDFFFKMDYKILYVHGRMTELVTSTTAILPEITFNLIHQGWK